MYRLICCVGRVCCVFVCVVCSCENMLLVCVLLCVFVDVCVFWVLVVACVFIACCVVLSSVHTYMRVMFMLCVAPGLLICV